MKLARLMVLTIDFPYSHPPPVISYPAMRALMSRVPDIRANPDGGRSYTYRMTAREIQEAGEQSRQAEGMPTPDGLASCLVALAREARDIGLGQASWAIELAVQMIGLQQAGGTASKARNPEQW